MSYQVPLSEKVIKIQMCNIVHGDFVTCYFKCEQLHSCTTSGFGVAYPNFFIECFNCQFEIEFSSRIDEIVHQLNISMTYCDTYCGKT